MPFINFGSRKWWRWWRVSSGELNCTELDWISSVKDLRSDKKRKKKRRSKWQPPDIENPGGKIGSSKKRERVRDYSVCIITVSFDITSHRRFLNLFPRIIETCDFHQLHSFELFYPGTEWKNRFESWEG